MTQAPVKGGHHFSVRVYYEDTDSVGMVYYANYLKFAERGRTEFLRSLGFDQWETRFGFAFVVRSCTIDYRTPAHLDDLLDVETRLVDLGGASLEVDQTIRRDDEELVHMRVRVACVREDGKVARMPAELRDGLRVFASQSQSKMRRSA
ncbi:MAG: tol-pal system-associated acyl-CoA thioesterase [Alphaproteobacteria bacterium]|nr:tol-pal system-associated acyl-CoA thioesterase [Alphaproteobacteria bacterium]